MPYQPITRVITIYIEKIGNVLKSGQNYAINVCPEHAEVIVGDKVVWQVQNAPRGVKKVTVGNFKRLHRHPHVRVRVNRPSLVLENTARVAKKTGLTHKARATEVGRYKYDVLFDGVSMQDPDIEIKRPS